MGDEFFRNIPVNQARMSLVRAFIPVSEPDISSLEKTYLNQALDSGWISSKGEFVERFEQAWAQECGAKHSLAVANGTLALHLVLAALDIGTDNEVIVPSLTFIASANAIKYVGATPVFCDVNRETWCIDPIEVAKLITPKTKAIICVDIYGNPCSMQELRKLCDEHGIWLIDDAAEAHYSTFQGLPTSSFSHVATFSFFGNKIITSGEGGAVVTSDTRLYQRMKLLRDQGMDPDRRYYFPEVGFNFRLTNLQCALLCAQIERSKELLDKRNDLFSTYNSIFFGVLEIEFQKSIQEGVQSPWLYTFLLPDRTPENLLELMKTLKSRGIETRPIFIPIHTLPPYSEYKSLELPNTTKISSLGISLPTSSCMSKREAIFVAQTLLEELKKL